MARVSTASGGVLVFGGTGMLGHEVVATFAEAAPVDYSARDPERAARAGLAGTAHRFDALTMDPAPLMRQLDPAVVVNALGVVKQLPDAEDPLLAITVNSLFPHRLSAACAATGARLIHVSTDCVFSGTLPLSSRYSETDAEDALDLYGRSKLLGEPRGSSVLTIRTSIIGWELFRRTGLLEWLASQTGTVVGFRNAIFSGLTTRVLARILRVLAWDATELQGLYHVASEPISKLELLLLLREQLGLDCTIEGRDEPVINRALDGALFAKTTGIAIPSWPEMAAEYANERSPQEAASAR